MIFIAKSDLMPIVPFERKVRFPIIDAQINTLKKGVNGADIDDRATVPMYIEERYLARTIIGVSAGIWAKYGHKEEMTHGNALLINEL